MKQKLIFSLGFEKLSLVDFVRMVKDQNVSRVVDVRGENMVCEGRGRFTPEQLCDILKNVNVDYVHLSEAGIPSELQTIPKGNGHFADFCREYLEMMAKNKKLLDKIKELFTDDRVLILSFEDNVNISHRLPFSEIVLSIMGKGYRIRHLGMKDLKPLVIPPPQPL